MFRFSIREMMLVTLVVGMAAGWWVERRCLHSQLSDVLLENSELRYTEHMKKLAWDKFHSELADRGITLAPTSVP